MLDKIATGLGAKALVGAVGSAVSGAYGVVSKTGQALGTAGKALTSAGNANQNTSNPSSNVITGKFGMAGTAGRQKVTGGGTLPAPKAIAKPQVSSKMPTEALLDTAVKYLVSIDKSLKSQVEFERRSYQEQAQVEREAIIETKSATTFSDIKDRLSGFKSNVKDNASTAATIAKFALILGGAASLVAAALDQKEFDALKQNVEEFKNKFSWLGDMASFIGLGGLAGFIFGGKGGRLKGGLIGIVASHVISRLYSSFSGGEYKTDTDGNVLIDQNGEPIKESRSMSAAGLGLSAAAGVIAARSIAKRLPATKLAAQSAGQLSRAAGSSSIAGVQAATRKGTSWLASRRGRKFLVILGRKLGKGLMAKVGKYLARIVAGLLLTATGVGAIPGILVILASIAFIGFDIFDIATSIYDAFNESAAEDTAAMAVPAKQEQTATKVAGTDIGSNAQSQVPVSNQAILEAIRMKESGNDYGAQNPVSSASGAYQFIDGTWQSLTKKYGIGTEYSKAKQAPPNIQDAVADKYVSDILSRAGGDVSKVPLEWFTGNIQGSSNHASPAEVAAYQSDWLRIYNGGKPDVKAATNSSFNDTSMADSVSGMVNAGAEKMGQIFGMLGSSIIKPGVEKKFAPSGGNVSEQINNQSMKLQNDITFGIKKEKAKDTITSPTISAGKARGVSPVKSVSSIDPNYQNMDVLTKYLSHFRLAA
jgi:hypothetical protein